MSHDHPRESELDWQPATSAPGEMYTPEGRIKAARVATAGLFDKNPRRKVYKRQMMRTGLLVAGSCGVLAVLIAVVAALAS